MCYEQSLVLHCVLLMTLVLQISVHHIFIYLVQLVNINGMFDYQCLAIMSNFSTCFNHVEERSQIKLCIDM